jgi:hypothetical protein
LVAAVAEQGLETIFGFKYLNSLMQIRDPEWKKIGSGIRDGKNSDPGLTSPGSATLLKVHFSMSIFVRF